MLLQEVILLVGITEEPEGAMCTAMSGMFSQVDKDLPANVPVSLCSQQSLGKSLAQINANEDLKYCLLCGTHFQGIS